MIVNEVNEKSFYQIPNDIKLLSAIGHRTAFKHEQNPYHIYKNVFGDKGLTNHLKKSFHVKTNLLTE